MKQITLISVGPGQPQGLTGEARAAIDAAQVVFCASRHEALAVPDKVRPLSPFGEAIAEMKLLAQQDKAVAVLVSGDAGLYSLLPLLKSQISEEHLHVIPGVSSLQAFMAALGLPWQEAAILSAHGRTLNESALCHEARTHANTLLLLDQQHDPAWVHQTLANSGIIAELIIGERIGYPDQYIAPFELRPYDPLCVALIHNTAPVMGLPPIGLADEAFERSKTPMTKREIRMLVLAALQLRPDAVVWDVGAGTGSVSVECARQCPYGQVYAIERDAAALELVEKNKAHFRLTKLFTVAGSAPEALKDLPVPTHVFLGGVGGAAAEVIQLLRGMNTSIRLVATAVTMESVHSLTTLMQPLPNFFASQIGVSRLERAGTHTLYRAQNPVTVFAADITCEEMKP